MLIIFIGTTKSFKKLCPKGVMSNNCLTELNRMNITLFQNRRELSPRRLKHGQVLNVKIHFTPLVWHVDTLQDL